MSDKLISLLIILMLSAINFGCSETKEPEKPAISETIESPPVITSPMSPEILSSQWVEGIHYNVVSDALSSKKEVVEYFSFWCPACYRFEAVIDAIKSGLSTDMSLNKVQVNFMRFTTPEIQDEATKAMLIGRQLGKEEALNAAIFAHIHEQGQKIESMNDLKKIVMSTGVTEAEFNKELNDESLSALLSENNKQIAELKEHLNGVPNIIVNGKYQARFTRDMTIEDIVELINWLGLQK